MFNALHLRSTSSTRTGLANTTSTARRQVHTDQDLGHHALLAHRGSANQSRSADPAQRSPDRLRWTMPPPAGPGLLTRASPAATSSSPPRDCQAAFGDLQGQDQDLGPTRMPYGIDCSHGIRSATASGSPNRSPPPEGCSGPARSVVAGLRTPARRHRGRRPPRSIDDQPCDAGTASSWPNVSSIASVAPAPYRTPPRRNSSLMASSDHFVALLERDGGDGPVPTALVVGPHDARQRHLG